MRLIPITMLLIASASVFAEPDIESAVRSLLAGEAAVIEHVGPSLQAKIDSLPDNCSVEVVIGDAEYPIGDGEATHHSLVECGASGGIGLRLKALGSNDYGVLGFWSLSGT